jgi:hypothetical protein
MRSVDSAVLTALGQRQLQARNFVWVVDVSGAHSVGFWDDLGNISANYIDINTGATLSRNYIGTGGLMAVDDVILVNDITIRTITLSLSQIDINVTNFVRGYNMIGATVEVHRGLFNPGTYQLVAPLEARLVGFMDTMEIVDPSENQAGNIKVTVTSHTRALTRSNTDTSTDNSQKVRNATDDFFKDVGVVSAWQIFWGTNKGSVVANAATTQTGYVDPNATT